MKMKVIALDCGMTLSGVTIKYEVSEDLMTPHKTDSITLRGNEGSINVGTMKKAGFLRVKATIKHEGGTYSTLATVGFDTDKLIPIVTQPDDFNEFWSKNTSAVAGVAVKPIMTLIPERCTDDVNVYHISYGNIGNTRMYGILTMPKAEGKYPAILRFPGSRRR